MNRFAGTYCNITEKNIERYNKNGFTYDEKFNSGNDYLIAYTVLGRNVCYKTDKDFPVLSKFRTIVDADDEKIPPCLADIDGSTFTISVDDQSPYLLIKHDDPLIKHDGPCNRIDVNSTRIALNQNLKQYPHDKVVEIMEHILSFQFNKDYTSSYIYVDTIVKELAKFGFNVNPAGKNLEGI